MAGVITDSDRTFVEQWENVSAMSNSIIRLDMRGDEKHELISGPRTFMITTEERLITQGRILDEKHDPFQNGCFRPVVVPDTVSVESNPNALSDDEIRKVLTSSDLAWGEWMAVLDSPETLRRMVELASEVEDISLKRYRQLSARMADVSPKRRIVQKDRDKYESITGGRSADYR